MQNNLCVIQKEKNNSTCSDIKRIQKSRSDSDCNCEYRPFFLKQYTNCMLFLISLSLFSSNLDLSENSGVQNTPFWNRVGYGMGFNAGVCLSGGDLERYYESYPFDDNKNYYYLYTLELSVSYCLNEKWDIEGGTEFGWRNLEDLGPRIMYIDDPTPLDSLYWGVLSSSDKASLLANKVNLKIKKANSFYLGLSGYWVRTYRKEFFYSWYVSDTIEVADVKRWCGGFGIVLGREFRGWFNGHLKPFAELEIGGAKEYRNNAPWQWEWDDDFWVWFTGVYLGLTYKIGEVN